jgi:MbtH protein
MNQDHYLVVINDEDQYSIWPAHRKIPAGWKSCNEVSPKQVCLDYIRKHWTDMRPRSLRQKHEIDLSQ